MRDARRSEALSSDAPSSETPSTEAAVRAIQVCYPQVYLACHTRHTRARSTNWRLSSSDSSVLAHLDERAPTRPATLARHLGVGAPTLSAALRRLESLGYVARQRSAGDGRAIELRLTVNGARAMRATSVLDASRVRAVLATLSDAERALAVRGLELLARAARTVGAKRGVAPPAGRRA
jgi:MarR family transcriptional regulator, organic hydroperoxide resistance regulator